MKRKAKDSGEISREDNEAHRKKQATETKDGIRKRFRPGLFDAATVQSYAENYAQSTPYLHSVVSHLMNDDLLRCVRREILENIHFTPKETDIYKIQQSGDLANLDGLPASALEKLPSLLKLRDALYGEEFRSWVSAVSGAGPLSGTKTDMAVNVYVPGCHLLCHDDVIGTRRVSYILYLTNPDLPWKAEWGGALRLYPTDEVQGGKEDGKTYKLPRAEWTKVIPPAWNQLSFFTVQPGESFHDVEEVYHRAVGEEEEDDGGRVRMAISGWFHIPQEGEDGFEPGLEEKLAERSSLQQLQGKADQFDEPQQQWQIPTGETAVATKDDDEDEPELTEEDLAFLIKYMTPNYLTPDTVEELTELFTEECLLQLTNFLSEKFSLKLKTSLENGDAEKLPWATSRPPHKHRYQYLHAQPHTDESASPLRQVLDELLPSSAFQKWLALVTGSKLKRCSVMARRFRQGLDYQLAQGYAGEQPQLEYTLCVTPSIGWGGEGEEEESEEQNGNSKKKSKKKGKKSEEVVEEEEKEKDNPGGYELYMAGEDSDSDSDSDEDNDGVSIPPTITTNSNTNNSQQQQSTTGAGPRRSSTKTKTKKHQKSDPAIYNSANSEEDDGILFSNPAGWNTLSLVLRDRGTLKFVKFVSKNAPGDRLDFVGGVEVDEVDDDDEGDDE